MMAACCHTPQQHRLAGLLAGIVLVDWMLVPNGCPLYSPMFATLFVLSLVLQRFVAST